MKVESVEPRLSYAKKLFLQQITLPGKGLCRGHWSGSPTTYQVIIDGDYITSNSELSEELVAERTVECAEANNLCKAGKIRIAFKVIL